MPRLNHTALLGLCAALTLTACGNGSLGSSTGSFGSLGVGSLSGSRTQTSDTAAPVVDNRKTAQAVELSNGEVIVLEQAKRRTVLGGGRGSIEDSAQVNKYIWNAALDVLSFLPVQTADPFTGVIVTGYGTPPGGSRAYRATIHVTDPALDARTLNLSLYTRGGAASEQTVQAVEDAILSRARQLRSGK
ncbi:uncharacterized protein DUF3576 [Pacificibacter maritimus]|uniref:Uncharacterized protein DUF3576 n=1 Tax=Pacificibacter maritimus TaxID=762213 RepID=A0A3N4UVV4_9RHOB|nr:DUF3576 domain-containing protein [Pacificibacter maritimus]RPE64844.1 uncharacterized protein DUF3576 [Pacificibacter maritimus]